MSNPIIKLLNAAGLYTTGQYTTMQEFLQHKAMVLSENYNNASRLCNDMSNLATEKAKRIEKITMQLMEANIELNKNRETIEELEADKAMLNDVNKEEVDGLNERIAELEKKLSEKNELLKKKSKQLTDEKYRNKKRSEKADEDHAGEILELQTTIAERDSNIAKLILEGEGAAKANDVLRKENEHLLGKLHDIHKRLIGLNDYNKDNIPEELEALIKSYEASNGAKCSE